MSPTMVYVYEFIANALFQTFCSGNVLSPERTNLD
jgi:hypothetical protein